MVPKLNEISFEDVVETWLELASKLNHSTPSEILERKRRGLPLSALPTVEQLAKRLGVDPVKLLKILEARTSKGMVVTRIPYETASLATLDEKARARMTVVDIPYKALQKYVEELLTKRIGLLHELLRIVLEIVKKIATKPAGYIFKQRIPVPREGTERYLYVVVEKNPGGDVVVEINLAYSKRSKGSELFKIVVPSNPSNYAPLSIRAFFVENEVHIKPMIEGLKKIAKSIT